MGPVLSWWGRWDLNPGSPAPQAGILVHQPKKVTGIPSFLGKLDDDPTHGYLQEYECGIIKTLLSLKANGKSDNTVKSVNFTLKRLSRETDLMNPEAVKLHIANLAVSNQTKQKLANNYNYFCLENNLPWNKPVYHWDTKIPIIPLKQNIEAITAAATMKTATMFTILAETGLEGAELHKIKRKDIDTEQGIITAEGNKGHRGRSFKLKQKTAEALRTYLNRHTQERPFPNPKAMAEAWREARTRAATRLNKPELKQIMLKSLRNYSAAQLYYSTQDPWRVMLHLGHKKLDTTQHYISGMIPQGEAEYTCKTAKTPEEAIALIESGFQYVTTIEGLQLFKKRK
jgi:integrase